MYMYKTIYNDVVYSYTQYIYKEYSQVNHLDRIYMIGLRTLTHIFKFLLLNNIDHAIIKTNCIKSYHYFCEFILQIQNNNIYPLNYTEASIFVFKKFINISLPKNKVPISENILHEMQKYSEIIIILIENYIGLDNKDLNIINDLSPLIKLLIPRTTYAELDNCIILIKRRSDNSTTFIKILTNVLTQKKEPNKNYINA